MLDVFLKRDRNLGGYGREHWSGRVGESVVSMIETHCLKFSNN